MYIVVVYDVASERNQPVLQFLRTHLHWMQNSVLEGEVTEAQKRSIENTLDELLEADDCARIYSVETKKNLDSKEIGTEKGGNSKIL